MTKADPTQEELETDVEDAQDTHPLLLLGMEPPKVQLRAVCTFEYPPGMEPPVG